MYSCRVDDVDNGQLLHGNISIVESTKTICLIKNALFPFIPDSNTMIPVVKSEQGQRLDIVRTLEDVTCHTHLQLVFTACEVSSTVLDRTRTRA